MPPASAFSLSSSSEHGLGAKSVELMGPLAVRRCRGLPGPPATPNANEWAEWRRESGPEETAMPPGAGPNANECAGLGVEAASGVSRSVPAAGPKANDCAEPATERMSDLPPLPSAISANDAVELAGNFAAAQGARETAGP